MLFAIDKNNKRVYIDQTHEKEDYFCPGCGTKLILKKGEIKAHHFAHQSNSICTDSWHYDMSYWHVKWQSRFPLDTQEIVKIKDGKKHRADVLLEDKKVVFEFQHSNMTPEEFNDRNSFYNSLGYKVVWVFDLSDQYENGSIDNYRKNIYKWSRPKKAFNRFVPKDNPNIELFFQIQISADDNEYMVELKKRIADGEELYLDETKTYYRVHKYDENELIKVTWAPESGFERFATDGLCYDENDIVNLFNDDTNEIEDKETVLGELLDTLVELYSKDHTKYYFGCPRSSTHICGNWDLDIPESKYNEIYPCSICEFSACDKYNQPQCKKRFVDLGIPMDTRIKILKKTSDGFISQMTYGNDGKAINLPTYINNHVKSVFDLWIENNCRFAIFKNIRTGKFIKIDRNPINQINKYRKVYGYFSNDSHSFNGPSSELYNCEKPEWICIWHI